MSNYNYRSYGAYLSDGARIFMQIRILRIFPYHVSTLATVIINYDRSLVSIKKVDMMNSDGNKGMRRIMNKEIRSSECTLQVKKIKQ